MHAGFAAVAGTGAALALLLGAVSGFAALGAVAAALVVGFETGRYRAEREHARNGKRPGTGTTGGTEGTTRGGRAEGPGGAAAGG